jgi:hypothetical protein
MLYLLLSIWLFGAFCMFLDTCRIVYTAYAELKCVEPIMFNILETELGDDSDLWKERLNNVKQNVVSRSSWFLRLIPCAFTTLKVWPLILFSLIFGQEIYESKIKGLIVSSMFLDLIYEVRLSSPHKLHIAITNIATLFEIATRISLLKSFTLMLEADNQESHDA